MMDLNKNRKPILNNMERYNAIANNRNHWLPCNVTKLLRLDNVTIATELTMFVETVSAQNPALLRIKD